MNTNLFGFKPEYPNGKRGFLIKRGHLMKNWKQRYFVLHNTELKYYVDETCTQLQGSYVVNESSLVGYHSGEFAGKSHVLIIEADKSDGKKMESLHVSCSNENDRISWHNAIDEAIHKGSRLVSLPAICSSNFYPELQMHVTYSKNVVVDDGNVLLPSWLAQAPQVRLSSTSPSGSFTSQQYSFLLLQQSSNSTTDLIWALANVSLAGSGEATSGFTEIASYQPPVPASNGGLTAFFFLAHLQPAPLSGDQLSAALALGARRSDFSAVRWSEALGLDAPSAINGFYCEFEALSDAAVSGVAVDVPMPSDSAECGKEELSSPVSTTALEPAQQTTDEVTDTGEVFPMVVRPKPIDIVPNAPLDSPASPSHNTRESNDTSSYSFGSSGESESPRRIVGVLKKSRLPRTAASPAKKLVSFLIVHPTLMSDSTYISPSFHEGYEEELDIGDDLPDYQVNYTSSSSNSTIGSAVSRVSSSSSFGIFPPHSQAPVSNDMSASNAAPAAVITQPLPSAVDAPSPLTKKLSKSSSDNNIGGRPLMQRVASAAKLQDFCGVFGVTTASIFEGEMMRKKFSGDLVMKESFVWIDPASKSIHWAKSATNKTTKHKHILLDKTSSYSLVNKDAAVPAADPTSNSSANSSNSSSNSNESPTVSGTASTSGTSAAEAAALSYRKAASGSLAGVIKGAELEDLTITITTETDQRLKIKIPPKCHAATLRAKEWFKVVKMLTQDTSK